MILGSRFLFQLNIQGIKNALTQVQAEFPQVQGRSPAKERVVFPLSMDQALDTRDAIAKALYTSLFTWLVNRANRIVLGGSAALKKLGGGRTGRESTGVSKAGDGRNSSSSGRRRSIQSLPIISVLDPFGFENLAENSFEQLCINYANECLHHHCNKQVFRLEQAEYAKEKIEWTPIPYHDNSHVIHMISKKPIGLLHLLDDESNFPKVRACLLAYVRRLRHLRTCDAFYASQLALVDIF